MHTNNINVYKIERMQVPHRIRKRNVMDFRVDREIGIIFRNMLSYSNSNNLFLALIQALQNNPSVVEEIKGYLKTEYDIVKK